MPKSQIIIDIVEDTVSIDKSLTRLMVLAKDVKNIQLETWAKNELNGYDGIDNLPKYRKSYSGSFKYSGINGGYKVNNAPLPAIWIDEKHRDICDINIVDGIKYITELANSEHTPMRDVTILANDIYEKSDGMITCTSISQLLPQTIYHSILAEVKNMMIIALCELEEKYGNLDKLGIDISKKKAVQINANNENLNKAVFNISFQAEHDKTNERWFSKIGWNIIVPIITAIIGAVVATIVVKILGY